jgi:ABC-2 type transport system ATP-binding protein
VLVAVKGAVAAQASLSALPGVASVEVEETPGETRARILCLQGSDPREEIFRLAVEKGWILRELSRAALSLEDVFVRLTRHDEAVSGAGAESPEAAPAASPEPS